MVPAVGVGVCLCVWGFFFFARGCFIIAQERVGDCASGRKLPFFFLVSCLHLFGWGMMAHCMHGT